MDTAHLMTLALLWASVLTPAVSPHEATACSPANRSVDLEPCLTGIRQGAINMSLFWFGTEYSARCPPNLRFTVDCFSRLTEPRSLVSLVFGNNTDLSSLDRYIEVSFTSAPGSYYGCDHNYIQHSEKEFSVDPLSPASHTPWDLRATPSVAWENNDTDLFTLFVVDVPNRFFHGIFTNIPGSNIQKAEVLKPYHGPQNSRNILNPYAFVLYKQSRPVSLTATYMALIAASTVFPVTDFVRDFSLEGPVGLTWVLASHDAYAVQRQWDRQIINNCAALVSNAYSSHKFRPFLPRNPPLKVFMQIHFETSRMEQPCGDRWNCVSPNSFFVDPIGNPIYSPAAARPNSTMKITVSMNKLFPNDTVDFVGKLYTLLAVDPDIPAPRTTVGTNERPLLHWLATNIHVEGGRAKVTNHVHPYRGPGPPDPKPHTYYFLLYEQRDTLQVNSTTEFTQGCPTRLTGRCTFDVNMFATTYNLTLVSATWLRAQHDAYMVCRAKQGTPTSTAGRCVATAGAPIVSAPTLPLAVVVVLHLSSQYRRWMRSPFFDEI